MRRVDASRVVLDQLTGPYRRHHRISSNAFLGLGQCEREVIERRKQDQSHRARLSSTCESQRQVDRHVTTGGITCHHDLLVALAEQPPVGSEGVIRGGRKAVTWGTAIPTDKDRQLSIGRQP